MAHADHLWGAIDDFGDSERFPNASYVISAAEWDFWTHPGHPGARAGLAQGHGTRSARILKALENKLERRKAGETIAPGLTYLRHRGTRRATCRCWWKTAASGC